jgi:hypothetical protein
VALGIASGCLIFIMNLHWKLVYVFKFSSPSCGSLQTFLEPRVAKQLRLEFFRAARPFQSPHLSSAMAIKEALIPFSLWAFRSVGSHTLCDHIFVLVLGAPNTTSPRFSNSLEVLTGVMWSYSWLRFLREKGYKEISLKGKNT